MSDENCSPRSIVSNCIRAQAIAIHQNSALSDRDVTAQFRPLAEEPDFPAFSMSSEVRRNICAPQRPLLPRGPDSSRTREGHSRWSSCSVTAFEWPQGYLSAATRWSASPLHSRGLTISSSEPNSFAVRIGGRFTPGSWQSKPLPRALLGTPRAVEDHAMQSAAFQGGASCIKDSAAFSFDEPQGSNNAS